MGLLGSITKFGAIGLISSLTKKKDKPKPIAATPPVSPPKMGESGTPQINGGPRDVPDVEFQDAFRRRARLRNSVNDGTRGRMENTSF